MIKINSDSETLAQLLAAGNLEEAKIFCDSLLQKKPDSEEILNNCGLVYAKIGRLLEAIVCFEKARDLNPENVAYHNNLSIASLSLGRIDTAKQYLYQALKINPHHAESYNNLGRLYYKQSLFNEAIQYFSKALRIYPDYWEAHYNLAHGFAKLNQMTQAKIHYQEVLRLLPNHPNAHFNLGLLFFEEENPIEAEKHLKRTLELTPNNSTAAQYLGNTYILLGQIENAIETFKKALELSPSLADVHHNLAVLYLRQNEKTKALEHFEAAIKLSPDNDTAKHMIIALKGLKSNQAPQKYIAELFDQYADYYDNHMKEKLHYKVPGLLRSAIAETLKEKIHAGRVLDLGCGTGLCGIFFRDMALELIGIDLSPKMIEKAKLLGAYDELVVGDLNDYLVKENVEPFDLIIAADVLVYMGDLSSLFQRIKSKIKNGGYFAFTTEHLEDESTSEFYFLKPTGRFAHPKHYIHKLANQHHFIIAHEERITPREHEGKAVMGDLYVLRKGGGE